VYVSTTVLLHKHWIRNLGLEAESAVTLLPPEEQNYIQYQVAKQLKKLQTQQVSHGIYNPRKHSEELKVLNLIKDKLHRNKAIVTKAVIIYQKDLEQKVLEFISKKGVDEINGNITAGFQKDLKNTINNCKILIDTENKGRYVNLNLETPTLGGLIEVRKDGTPIFPLINYQMLPPIN